MSLGRSQHLYDPDPRRGLGPGIGAVPALTTPSPSPLCRSGLVLGRSQHLNEVWSLELSLLERGRVFLLPPPGGVSPSKGIFPSTALRFLILSTSAAATTTMLSAMVATLAVIASTAASVPTLRFVLRGCAVIVWLVRSGGQVLG